MSAQTLVDPGKIESELMRLWSACGKEKTRACLFNLIVYNKLSSRTDYIRDIVQKVSEKYPCRVIFISLDPDAPTPYIKTAVSVVGSGSVACDYIDIGVAGTEIEKAPFVLLPHLIPDLPIQLLWTEDPNKPHPLFDKLLKLSEKVIFDSESADSLLAFSKKVLELKAEKKIHIGDLNWARTEGWRDLAASLFRSAEKLEQIKKLHITYNNKTSPFFCHTKVQSFYFLAWLSTRLKWSFEKSSQKLDFYFKEQTAHMAPVIWDNLGAGAMISLKIETAQNHLYDCERIREYPHNVLINTCTLQQCELPYRFLLGKTATGQSLVKEVITKGTSAHYLEMLEALSLIDKDKLC